MEVSQPLTSFLDWASRIQKDHGDVDFAIIVRLCRPTANRAANLEFEGGELIGQLTFWSGGSAYGEVLDASGHQRLVRHWEFVDATVFDAEFVSFTTFLNSRVTEREVK